MVIQQHVVLPVKFCDTETVHSLMLPGVGACSCTDVLRMGTIV